MTFYYPATVLQDAPVVFGNSVTFKGSITASAVAGLPPVLVQPTGTSSTDTAAIQNALSATGNVLLGPGTFYIQETTAGQPALTVPYGGVLRGAGGTTILNYLGSTSCIYVHNTISSGRGDPYPVDTTGSEVSNLVVDGTSAGTSAVGIDAGDGDDGFIWRVRVSNFPGASQIGLHLNNQFFYTEKWRVFAQLFNCQNPVIIETNGGATSSFEYNDFEFHINANAGQNGVVIRNHCNYANARLAMRGNFATAVGTVATAALTIGGGATNGVVNRSWVDIALETNPGHSGGGSSIPTTILFGSSANQMLNCYGRLSFSDGWTSSNATYGQLSFGGMINGDNQIVAVNAAPTGWAQAAAPVNFQPTDPAGSTSATLVMLGLGSTQQTTPVTYTPQSSGLVYLNAIGSGYNTSGSANANFQIGGRYGTNPTLAPLNGAAVSGSRWGAGGDPTLQGSGASKAISWGLTDLLSLTPGTSYWFDVADSSPNGIGTATIHKISICISETS